MLAIRTSVREELDKLVPPVELLDFQRLEGGHSGLTYIASTSHKELVVKATPVGRPARGRHDMARQARIVQALAPTPVPVPVVVASHAETPSWFATERAPGDSYEPIFGEGDITPELAATRMRDAAVNMARLHEVDPVSIGITEEPLTPADELQRWARTLEAVPAGLVPRGSEFLAYLEEDIPLPYAQLSIIHGDFRLGNMLYVADKLQAIIDWEIWSVGDPRIDMAWFALYNEKENFPGVGVDVPGLPNTAELISIYQEFRGIELDFGWFLDFGRFKTAVIMAHNLHRHLKGRHDNPAQERLPATIENLVATGIRGRTSAAQ